MLDPVSSLDRLIRTLGPLPAGQLWHLVRNRIFPHRDPKRSVRLAVRPWLRRWQGASWRSGARGADGSFTFLNKTSAPSDSIWRDARHGRLWLYHLHYLDDLDVPEVFDVEDKRSLMTAWIAGNPPFCGTGWEPYPLSLRIVNVVKFLSRSPEAMTHEALSSLILQTLTLESRLEHHLRANHLFENAKALAFAGSLFEGEAAERWLASGLGILDEECVEQFLSDGGHFELSPMYHGTVLWGLCDLIALAEATGLQPLVDRRADWQRLARNGVDWYTAMTHPDGEIAFFNDAAFGQAPNLAAVCRYLDMLHLRTSSEKLDNRGVRLTALAASGYFRVDHDRTAVSILDAGRVGPGYQPAHAHADTLSFEMSVFGQRLLVNSGTSTYDRSPQRASERGTAAHNTVVIDDQNSSDMWAVFRVGRRAVPKVTIVKRDAGQVVIDASHDGYRRFSGGATHHRRWEGLASQLRVADRIEGGFKQASGHFHFHPDIEAKPGAESGLFILRLPNSQSVRMRISGGHAELLPSTWHPEFGRNVPSQMLRVRFDGRDSEAEISW